MDAFQHGMEADPMALALADVNDAGLGVAGHSDDGGPVSPRFLGDGEIHTQDHRQAGGGGAFHQHLGLDEAGAEGDELGEVLLGIDQLRKIGPSAINFFRRNMRIIGRRGVKRRPFIVVELAFLI